LRFLTFLEGEPSIQEALEDTPVDTKRQVKDAVSAILASSSNFSDVLKEEWLPLLPEFMNVRAHRRPRSLSAIGSYPEIKPQTPRSALQSPTRGSLVLDADEKSPDDSKFNDESHKEYPNLSVEVMVKLSQLWKIVTQEGEGDQDQNDAADDQKKEFSCE